MDSPTKRHREPTETQDPSQDDTPRDHKNRKTNDEQIVEEAKEDEDDEEEEVPMLAYKMLLSMVDSTWDQHFWTFDKRFKKK